ncbi:MAG TPA: hypothetical protein VM093_02675 [Aeromicrobium sp.]|nr:hypothetical protein [Aeromicrobium sp.]
MAARARTRTLVIYGLIVVAAVVATLFGTSNGHIFGITPTPHAPIVATATPLNPVDAQPAPALFKNTDLLTVSTKLTNPYRRAETNIKRFYADQPTGKAADDRAFIAWAARQIAIEPSVGARRFEKAEVLDARRSAKRDLAARWLGVHGCRDVWTSYVLEQKRFRAADDQVAKQSELAAVLALAARTAARGQARFSDEETATVPAPCAPRPAPAPEDCGCSYPSATAAVSAAARLYLTALQPAAGAQYRWMEKQVDLAPVYQGYELPSDVEAGAYLGYLVGRYFLASRGYADLIPTPTPTPTARYAAR